MSHIKDIDELDCGETEPRGPFVPGQKDVFDMRVNDRTVVEEVDGKVVLRVNGKSVLRMAPEDAILMTVIMKHAARLCGWGLARTPVVHGLRPTRQFPREGVRSGVDRQKAVIRIQSIHDRKRARSG